MVRHAVILAGGAGTRLWPASIDGFPKQFLRPHGGPNFLQLTFARAIAACPEGEAVIVTSRADAEMTAEALAGVDAHGSTVTILAEPAARNTAPALALAAAWLAARHGTSEVCLALPADHLIEPVDAFAADVELGGRLAADGRIVVFGVKPTDPNTGYGYIHVGKPIPGGGFDVEAFTEKPAAEAARAYLEGGRHYWNSGLYEFRLDRFQAELAAYAPAVAAAFSTNENLFEKPRARGNPAIVEVSREGARGYDRVPSVSIDYALAERSRTVAMVKATFGWNDVGSWDEAAPLLAGQAPVYQADSNDCTVVSDLPVGLVGVESLVVTVANGRVLVCRKGSSQKVREIALADRTAEPG